MYSVVLAAMLTTTSTAPAWGGGGWYNYGGCYGCSGCRGGCFGCYGCGGCYGCWGSSYGCYGCNGCWGGSCYGCSGCWGSCSGCYGGGYSAVVIQPIVIMKTAETKPAEVKKTSRAAAPAQVIVQLPAQTELYIDGQRSVSATTTRKIMTPTLPAGEAFYYTLRAELVRDGQAIQKEQRVLLRAGEVARVDFRDLAPPAAVANRE